MYRPVTTSPLLGTSPLANTFPDVRFSVTGRGSPKKETSKGVATKFDLPTAIEALPTGSGDLVKRRQVGLERLARERHEGETVELARVIDGLLQGHGRKIDRVRPPSDVDTFPASDFLPGATSFQRDVLYGLVDRYASGVGKASVLVGNHASGDSPVMTEILYRVRVPSWRRFRLYRHRGFTDHPANPLDSHTIVALMNSDFDSLVKLFFGESLDDEFVKDIPRGPSGTSHRMADGGELVQDNIKVDPAIPYDEAHDGGTKIQIDGLNLGVLSLFPGLRTFGNGCMANKVMTKGIPVVSHESRHHVNNLIGLHDQRQVFLGQAKEIEGLITNPKNSDAIVPLAALWLSSRYYASALSLQDELLAYASETVLLGESQREDHLEHSAELLIGFYAASFRRITAQFINSLQGATGMTAEGIDQLIAHRRYLMDELEGAVSIGSEDVIGDLLARKNIISPTAFYYLGLQPIWHWGSVDL